MRSDPRNGDILAIICIFVAKDTDHFELVDHATFKQKEKLRQVRKG